MISVRYMVLKAYLAFDRCLIRFEGIPLRE